LRDQEKVCGLFLSFVFLVLNFLFHPSGDDTPLTAHRQPQKRKL
jgi:hypothetical protein